MRNQNSGLEQRVRLILVRLDSPETSRAWTDFLTRLFFDDVAGILDNGRVGQHESGANDSTIVSSNDAFAYVSNIPSPWLAVRQ